MVPDGRNGWAGAAVPGSVRRAVAHMRADLARPVTARGLARVAGVPERTLRTHFLRFLGMPPLAWFRCARLAAVRAALLAPGAGETVAAAAARAGFLHAARFASEYRRRFGEPPSATLDRARAAAVARGPAVVRGAVGLVVAPLRVPEGARVEERALAVSLTEQLAAGLSQAPSIAVRLAGAVPERETGARYQIAGLVMRAGNRLRVVLRLLAQADGTHLWGDAFDGEPGTVFDLQDRVVGAALGAVASRVEGAEIARAQRMDPAALGARDLVLRAWPLVLAADPDSAEAALRMLREAVGMDPADATAPALAAWCHAQSVSYFRAADSAAALSAARMLASRALALDLGSAVALVAASGVALAHYEVEDAHMLMARARAVDPHHAWVWERLGWLDCFAADPEASLGDFACAMRLKPAGLPLANCAAGIGYARFGQGRYAEAVLSLRRALAFNPRAVWVHRMLAPCYLLLDERAAAARAVRALREACPPITGAQVVGALPPGVSAHGHAMADGLSKLGLPP